LQNSRHRAIAASLILLGACASLGQLAALRRVDFSLGSVRDGAIAAVPLARIANARDLSAIDLARVTYAVARRNVPLDMILDIRADNPADNRTAATLVRLDWTLFLDDRETVSGVLDTAIAMPPGQATIVALAVRLNLVEFFDGPAESLIDIAAGLAGVRADPTRVTLRATPTVNTPLGPISYPAPITIAVRGVDIRRTPPSTR
jgi:hypothetical protein